MLSSLRKGRSSGKSSDGCSCRYFSSCAFRRASRRSLARIFLSTVLWDCSSSSSSSSSSSNSVNGESLSNHSSCSLSRSTERSLSICKRRGPWPFIMRSGWNDIVCGRSKNRAGVYKQRDTRGNPKRKVASPHSLVNFLIGKRI